MTSHFLPTPGVAVACAVAGSLALFQGNCCAQNPIAADYATNSTYAGGWLAGQKGGNGFGACSTNGTDATPPGQYQVMSSSSPIGSAWTLLSHSSSSGLAN